MPMRFLCDMGVSTTVAAWLRDNGHDATHLRDEGLQRLPNGEIFAKAHAEKRVVLTFDLDFAEIAAASGRTLPSVVVFRLHNARSQLVISRLGRVLEESSDALTGGAIITVEDFRHRVRRLPIE
jgi:predicted nuclease of predicted toxin-antitoxin system